MSGTLIANTAGTVVGAVASILLKPKRGFGPSTALIIPDVTIEEHHTDRLALTKHPVQQGAVISDHAFKIPPIVRVKAGWSNSSLAALFSISSLADVAGILTDGLYGESYPQRIYKKLLALQNSLTPFDLYTGKRSYQNMMMADLGVTTDASSEYALMITATFENVNIVAVATATLPSSTQADPSATASTVDKGTQAATTSTHSESFLSQLATKVGL